MSASMASHDDLQSAGRLSVEWPALGAGKSRRPIVLGRTTTALPQP